MSFWPEWFNYRDPAIVMLDLAEIDTPDGPVRFMIGTDGVFTDIDGNDWVGSQLIGVGSLEVAIDGIAPEGQATLSFFQDPAAPDLISEIRELGVDYIAGREIRFLVQPLRSVEELHAPTVAPRRWLTRTMRTLSFSASGAQDRSIALTFEAWPEQRTGARRIRLNTDGHAKLLGEANPSLDHMPTTNAREESEWG